MESQQPRKPQYMPRAAQGIMIHGADSPPNHFRIATAGGSSFEYPPFLSAVLQSNEASSAVTSALTSAPFAKEASDAKSFPLISALRFVAMRGARRLHKTSSSATALGK